ncbi:Ribulose bisphosphate carboxylase small chain 3, chloroplastic [Turnera subulata]|uniref:Ribulose bisphosphate carboxylase small subunit, chloroplastic n=1 Tax=Turnera subulata TaxID=218843 RepID=A0A9Q0F686_9ROSI|nr:Ribulose bisphosphate carboxylase small chain 3, chloroplastic [Turnera subulata]
MASSVFSTTAALVAPYNGVKFTSAFPVTLKTSKSLPTNGSKIRCMQVWPPYGKKKYETLSYLPDLDETQLASEIEYLIRNGWIPCLEFETQHGFVYRENHRSPGYYDGRYWTMWKLPMYGCTDPAQVLKEVNEAKKAYPNAFIRIIGFDNVRQVQCISFIAYKPPGY